MGLFDFFKKDKEEDAKIDYTVDDLKKGFIVDYFLKSWEVKKAFSYDWGNGYYSKEYLLDAGNESMYLSVEDDDGIACSVWHKIDIFDIDENLANEITRNDEAPSRIVYDNKTYVRKESSQGYCTEEGTNEENELVNWMYQNKDTKEYISINRWGEEEYDVTKGVYVRAGEFSNILPR